MDDALKARLIGASILVVLAVALLPELLSGPKAPPANAAAGKGGSKVITIDLGGAVEASRAPRPDVVPEPAVPAPTMPAAATPAATNGALDDTSEPEPEPIDEATVATSPPTAEAPVPVPAAQTAQVTAKPKPSPATEPASNPEFVPAAAPKPGAAGGKYAVQVGAFSSAEGARKLVADLKGAGFPAYVLTPAPGKKLHRVRVGPVADRGAADQLASRLKARGLPVAVTADG